MRNFQRKRQREREREVQDNGLVVVFADGGRPAIKSFFFFSFSIFFSLLLFHFRWWLRPYPNKQLHLVIANGRGLRVISHTDRHVQSLLPSTRVSLTDTRTNTPTNLSIVGQLYYLCLSLGLLAFYFDWNLLPWRRWHVVLSFYGLSLSRGLAADRWRWTHLDAIPVDPRRVP